MFDANVCQGTIANLFSRCLFLLNEKSFNPDINEQAQEDIFSRKLQKPNHPS